MPFWATLVTWIWGHCLFQNLNNLPQISYFIIRIYLYFLLSKDKNESTYFSWRFRFIWCTAQGKNINDSQIILSFHLQNNNSVNKSIFYLYFLKTNKDEDVSICSYVNGAQLNVLYTKYVTYTNLSDLYEHNSVLNE